MVIGDYRANTVDNKQEKKREEERISGR